MRAGLLEDARPGSADTAAAHAVTVQPLRLQPDNEGAPASAAASPVSDARYARAQYLLMVITFMDAVEYGVVMPSLWGYLLETLALQRGTDEPGSGLAAPGGDHFHDHYISGLAHSYYGVILAAFSFASMLAKPFLGFWCDRRTFKEVFGITLAIGIVGNVVYSTARHFKMWELLLAGRLLSGAGCANSALSYAYISRTVEPSVRSAALAKISLSFPLGMVMGPAFNAITGALDLDLGAFKVDPSNSPGLLIAFLMLIELLLLTTMLPEPPPYAPAAAAPAQDGQRNEGLRASFTHAGSSMSEALADLEPSSRSLYGEVRGP